MQERFRKGLASAAAWVRTPAAVQAAIVLLAVVVGVIVGMLLIGPPSAPPVTEPPVAETSAPVPEQAQASAPAPEQASDWADSVVLPEFVTEGPPPGATRAYQPVGGGAAPRPSPAPRPADIDPATVRAVAVVRGSGSSIGVFDIGLGPSSANPAEHTRWALLGDCGADLRLNGPWPAGQGEVRGPLGEWLFGLAVPTGACRAFGDRVLARRAPSASLRRALAWAVQTSASVRGLGAPAFQEGDLVEVVQAGSVVWGVFRANTRTTQIYPPPPRPQLAFVAVGSGERWDIVWSQFSPTASEVLGLAGVADLDGDGQPEAYFGLRSADGAAELLQVASRGAGWDLLRRLPLGRVIRR